MKRTIFKWVPVLAVMKPVKFYKKTTIKQTFLPCEEAGNFFQRIFILKWRKKEKTTEWREVCEVFHWQNWSALTGPSWSFFWNLDMDFLARLWAVCCSFSLRRAMFLERPPCNIFSCRLYVNQPQMKGRSRGRLAYMISLARHSHT